MDKDSKPTEKTVANDNVSHNAHYDRKDNPEKFDERDLKDSTEDWNAEQSRTGRHK